MPSTKVSAATVGAALSAIAVWALVYFAHVTIPDEVKSAIGVLFVTLVTLASGYLVPESNPSPSGVAAARAGKGAARPPTAG